MTMGLNGQCDEMIRNTEHFFSFNDIGITYDLALSAATKCRIIRIMVMPNSFIKSQRDCNCPFKV